MRINITNHSNPYKLYLLLLLFFINNLNSLSTTLNNNNYAPVIPDFPYKSPEAAAFQKYGEYSFNEYTGTPDISIPLYTINDKDITIPINLSYDASGIKVDQEASWVGLGWNLMIGGCINYIPAGQVDKYNRTGTWEDYLTAYDVKKSPMKSSNLKSYNDSDFFDFENGYKPENKKDYATSVLNDLVKGLGERDYFSANIFGKSFCFFFNPYTCKMEIIGKANEKFQIIPIWNSAREDDASGPRHEKSIYDYVGFQIKDAEGNIYEFDNKETTFQGGISYTSAWNLSRIFSKKGTIAKFNYSDNNDVIVIPKLNEEYIFISSPQNTDFKNIGYGAISNGMGYQCTTGDGIFKINKSFLSSIETDNQTINFQLSQDRNDLKGAIKLLSFSIIQNDTKKILKSYKFNYDYFVGSNVGGDYMQYNNKDKEDFSKVGTYIRNRLKLLSIDELSNNEQQLETSFEYNDVALPLKTSYAKDFWGYFNGEENINKNSRIDRYRTLIPSANEISLGIMANNDIVSNFCGGNRFTNINYSNAGLLKKITYPTKGYTMFSYESNSFSNYDELTNQKSFLALKVSASVFNNNNKKASTSVTNFTIEKEQTVKVSVYISFLDYDIPNVIGSGVIIQRIDNGHNDRWEFTIRKIGNVIDKKCNYSTVLNLQPGKYIIIGQMEGCKENETIYNNRNMCSGTVEYISYEEKVKPPFLNGGGIRLEGIANYDSNSQKLTSTEYEYTEGRLLCPIFFGDFFIKGAWHLPSDIREAEYSGYTLSSSSLSKINTFVCSMAGGTVGYSKVNKKDFSSSDMFFRKTESEYANEPAKNILRNFYQFENFDNGLLLKRTISDQNKVLSVVKNTYSYFKKPYTCNIMLDDRSLWDICTIQHTTSGVYSEGMAKMADGLFNRYYSVVYSYYFIWNKLDKTIKTLYDGNGIEETHEYSYNEKNYQIDTDKFNSSEKDVYYSLKYSYPSDEDSNPICNLMVKNNILNPITRQVLSKNNNKIKEKYNKYGYVFNKNYFIFNLDEELFAIGNNPLENRMKYTYDINGNIQSIIKDNSEKIVYLWSYNYTYPVVEIRGASFNEVSEWLGFSAVTDLATKRTPSESDLFEIRRILNTHGVLVKLYLYDPGIGIISEIESNGKKTTYTYNSFNKLSAIKNEKGEIISNYIYHYKE